MRNVDMDTLLKEAEAIDLEALFGDIDLEALFAGADALLKKAELSDIWETFFEGKACNAADLGPDLPEGRRPESI